MPKGQGVQKPAQSSKKPSQSSKKPQTGKKPSETGKKPSQKPQAGKKPSQASKKLSQAIKKPAQAAKKPSQGASAKKTQKKGSDKNKQNARGLTKATKAAKAHKKGVTQIKKRLRYTVHFRLKPTLKQPRSPKYAKKTLPGKQKMDKYRIVRHPLTTEHAMKKIEDHNTLVFVCDNRASKPQIKRAVKQLYNVDCIQVNTLIRPDGLKKAYVKLKSEDDALDVANQIGII